MLSLPHLVVLFVIALVIFGPQKLPELARMLGKMTADFRRMTTDFRVALEDEVREMDRQTRLREEAKAALQPAPPETPSIAPPALPEAPPEASPAAGPEPEHTSQAPASPEAEQAPPVAADAEAVSTPVAEPFAAPVAEPVSAHTVTTAEEKPSDGNNAA